MINTLFALVCAVFSSMQSVFTKSGAKKCPDSKSMSFNAFKTGSAFFVFLIFCLIRGVTFHLPSAIYATLYALFLVTSTFCGYIALAIGSMALSSLIASYSVVIPVIYGFAVLGEKLYPIRLVGLVLLLISLFIFAKRDDNKNSGKLWALFIGIAVGVLSELRF